MKEIFKVVVDSAGRGGVKKTVTEIMKNYLKADGAVIAENANSDKNN